MKLCLVINKQNSIFLNSFKEALTAHNVEVIPFVTDGSADMVQQRQQLLALLQAEHIHHILSINEHYHGVVNLYDDSILAQAKINVWYVDTMQNEEYRPDLIAKYHRIYTFEPSDVSFAKQRDGLNVTYLPLGAGRSLFAAKDLDESSFFENYQYTYDICFVGLVAKSEYRLSILNRVAKVCRENGYTLALYGHFWHSNHPLQRMIGAFKFKRKYPELYPYVHNQKLTPQDVAKLYEVSKICLNIHNPHHKGLNCRSFEIMGNGNFLLTDVKDTSGLIIREGVHYDVYTDEDDLERKINYYLTHDKERKDIAFTGAKVVRERYTINTLIGEVLNFD